MHDAETGDTTRRATLGAGGALLAGLAGLAGCLGLGGGSGDGGGDDGGGDDGGGDGGGDESGGDGSDGDGSGGDGGATTTTPPWPADVETRPLPERGDDRYLGDVETYEIESAQHVSPDADLDYDPTPPVGGRHYSGWVDPGFYEEPQPLGNLVHNLEHGAVVVYYDPSAVTDAASGSLREFAEAHTDPWAHVVVVPSPVEDPKSPYVLTAWGALLRLAEYDPRAVRAFLAEYLGRGPENPVR